jgi:hypothetical protein
MMRACINRDRALRFTNSDTSHDSALLVAIGQAVFSMLGAASAHLD